MGQRTAERYSKADGLYYRSLVIDYQDPAFAVAALTADVDYKNVDKQGTQSQIATVIPVDSQFVRADLHVFDAWAGTGITDVEAEIGITADVDKYLTIQSLLATGRYQNAGGAPDAGVLDGVQVSVRFTATGANFGDGSVTALTAGKVECRIIYRRVPPPNDLDV